jgi:hypothetical protein
LLVALPEGLHHHLVAHASAKAAQGTHPAHAVHAALLLAIRIRSLA